MRASLPFLLFAALALAGLAACGEKPPRVVEGEQAYNNDGGENRLRERTQTQNESSRIY